MNRGGKPYRASIFAFISDSDNVEILFNSWSCQADIEPAVLSQNDFLDLSISLKFSPNVCLQSELFSLKDAKQRVEKDEKDVATLLSDYKIRL